MSHIARFLMATSVLGLSLVAWNPARADGDGDGDGDGNHRTLFVQTNLISNLPGVATITAPNLLNAWGLAFPPTGDFWINANNAGLVALVDGTGVGNPHLPAVTIPLPAPPLRADIGSTSAPTGVIWNPTGSFDLPGTNSQAIFLFDTEDGTIAAWNPAVNLTNAVIAVDNSKVGTGGAVYKGLAFGITSTGAHLYATNFRAGTVDVFDATFTGNLVDGAVPNSTTATNISGDFTDPDIPAGFAPFGIQNINGDLYVSYAKQDQPKHDPANGAHRGFVDVFSTDGVLLRRLADGGSLNSPWGMVQAPASFGRFANDILVGNFGDGRINVFESRGEPRGPVLGTDGRPLVIDGLWALLFGGGVKSSPDTLYFTAGPDNETNGLFGTIVPQQD